MQRFDMARIISNYVYFVNMPDGLMRTRFVIARSMMATWRSRGHENHSRRIAKRLEFHHTPKHASWLNMAEIEFSVFSRSCLSGRLPDEATLCREVQALEMERNEAQARINWRFGIQDARTKLHRLYPSQTKLD